jgi:hypothetical protein
MDLGLALISYGLGMDWEKDLMRIKSRRMYGRPIMCHAAVSTASSARMERPMKSIRKG